MRCNAVVDPAGQLLLEEAVALYRADLLAGFNLRDAPEFENWLSLERETLRRAVTSALEMLVQLHAAHGSYGPALDFAHRWLALEPEEERAHRTLIDLYLRSGDPAAARRQYELCTRVLAEEIGVPPSEETQLLAHRIRSQTPPGAPMSEQATNTIESRLPLGETRLVTVLVTGLGPAAEVDNTFSAVDEAAIQRQERFLLAAQAILWGYGAYVAPSLGDKTLAVFGIPSSHEDDPERAVRAALDLRLLAMSAAQAATGVHTGVVYLQGAPAAQEVVILGSAVDTALRLYTSAAVGEILVTPATQRLTHGAVVYSAQSAVLAGTRSPATVFRAERLQETPRKVRGIPGLSAPLVGRGLEIAQLLEALRQMQATGEGRFIVVSGAAGVGKSRLVAELHDRLVVEDAADLTWLEGRCLELTSDTAYGPFREIVRAFARFNPDTDDEATRAQRLLEQLTSLWQQAGQPETQLGEVAPFLANLLSLRLPPDYASMRSLAPEEAHFRTVDAIVSFASALGRRKPTVLVFEDLHWADPHSLNVVQRLATRIPEAPLAIVCVLRPEPDFSAALRRAAQGCPAHAVEIQLAELSEPESRLLVEQLLKLSPLPAALGSLALEQAEGNPFFIEETLHTLIDDGILVRQGEAWHVDAQRLQQARAAPSIPVATRKCTYDIPGISQIPGMSAAISHVPESVQSVLLSRLDRQPAHLRKALQVAAVIGREAPLALLGRLLPAATNIPALLAMLEQAGFLVADPAHPRTQVIFRHVLQQAVAYQTIGSAERRALHGRVAQAIESLWPEQQAERVEQLAYHYSRSDDTAKAVEFLVKAGERSQRLFLNSAAIAFFEQALALQAQLPDREAQRIARPRAVGLSRPGAAHGRRSPGRGQKPAAGLRPGAGGRAAGG